MSSPCQFVPSTPCLHLQSTWSGIDSPAATVPGMQGRYQSRGRDNRVGASTAVAVVPHTPRIQVTHMSGRHQAMDRLHRTLMESRTPPISLPQKVGELDEQVVPCNQMASSEDFDWIETCPPQQQSSTCPKTKTQHPRREAVLKQRLSQQTDVHSDMPWDLLSNDKIFK